MTHAKFSCRFLSRKSYAFRRRNRTFFGRAFLSRNSFHGRPLATWHQPREKPTSIRELVDAASADEIPFDATTPRAQLIAKSPFSRPPLCTRDENAVRSWHFRHSRRFCRALRELTKIQNYNYKKLTYSSGPICQILWDKPQRQFFLLLRTTTRRSIGSVAWK